MTDLMVRWNAGFIRGLAQNVLERAKSIRTSLTLSQSVASKKSQKPATAKKRSTKAKTKRRTTRRKNG